jgi:hypothetical protein
MQLEYKPISIVTSLKRMSMNFPAIIPFDDMQWISIVQEDNHGFVSEIQVHNSEGTYLAKIRSKGIYPTEDGERAGIVVRTLPKRTICELEGNELFEIEHQSGGSINIRTGLFATKRYFIKSTKTLSPSIQV